MDTTAIPAPALPGLKALDRLLSADRIRAELNRLWPPLKGGRPDRIIVIGAANEGARLIRCCLSTGIGVEAVADDSPARQGKILGETHSVGPVESLAKLDRAIPVIIASHRTLGVTKRLLHMGFRTVAPFAALQCLAPETFLPHPFYRDWIEDLSLHRDRYRALSALLADDLSRRVLDACISYRMTCNPLCLESVIESDLYNTAGMFTLGTDEVYVDGGAFDGDSVLLFIERTKGIFDRVLAFEPDTGTFLRLRERFAGTPRVETINKGLYSRSAVLRFYNDGSRASSFMDAGSGASIPVTSLDEILDKGRVTFIKMNIEGAELAALDGAAQSICRWAPRLAISAYHRASDLWGIPAKVRALRSDYRLYLRQHDGGVIETVLYAVPTGEKSL